MAFYHVTDYPSLLSTLENPEKIVYLCGAGASMSLGEHRSSWPAWLAAGKTYLTSKEQYEFDTIIGSWTARELIEAATYLLEHLKANGSYASFMDFTISSICPRQQDFIRALCKIWRSGDFISTTNYDLAIEKAVDAGTITYSSPGEILSILKGRADNSIIHLHGAYDNAHSLDDIIANGEQYQMILKNAGAQFIQNLLSTHPIMIIGCGATVDDPNLSGFLSFVTENLKIDVPYFYIMKEGDTIPTLPGNAVPVYYGSEYDALPGFLDEMASYRLRWRTDVRPLMFLNPYTEPGRLSSAFGRMHFSNAFNPFVGREDELRNLDSFLGEARAANPLKISWWGITGEGGIGKSRLVLEWLRRLPLSWFGFFARTTTDRNYYENLTPFSNTVIVFDYVIGNEQRCAAAVLALIRVFEASPYKLRILLIERHHEAGKLDWLEMMKASMDAPEKLTFQSAMYLNGSPRVDDASLFKIAALKEADEIWYVQEYLKAYAAEFLEPAEADRYLSDIGDSSARIQRDFRLSLKPECHRPLYLSIFTEVWIHREGVIDFTDTGRLLEVYFEKETERWKAIFGGDEDLLNSYLRLLAMGCAIERFNISDVYGSNYLRRDCDLMIRFLQMQDTAGRKKRLLSDLFIMEDILEETNPDEITIVDKILSDATYSPEEKLVFMAPYVKLYADPKEMYRNMLKNAGAEEAEEEEEGDTVPDTGCKDMLPDRGWIIEPVYPDIIREFIVGYVVEIYQVVPFTRLARENSVFGLVHFLTTALDDFPDSVLFQRMAVTPPEEILNYAEYYLSLLTCTKEIQDLKIVERQLIGSEAVLVFAWLEMELWRRIAITLGARKDMLRLQESAMNFIEYARKNVSHPKVREAIPDVIGAYGVELHNAKEVEKYQTFLDSADKLADLSPEDEAIAACCCDGRARLMHLKFCFRKTESSEYDWNRMLVYRERFSDNKDISILIADAAEEYIKYLPEKQRLEEIDSVIGILEQIYAGFHLIDIAESLALAVANKYIIVLEKMHIFVIPEKAGRNVLKECREKVKILLEDFRDSQHVRSAYAVICCQEYLQVAPWHDVPRRVLERLRQWSRQYTGEIEFQESYFYALYAHFQYLMKNRMEKEARKCLHEMERVAGNTDYSIYNEENEMLRILCSLR